MFALTTEPIASAAWIAELSDPKAGALVTFEGWVRNRNEGRDVLRLEYEGYAELARREGRRILQEALAKHDILGARCVHRLGAMELGDTAVWVGVSSVHRAEAFDACEYVIDQIKVRLPIWKKEYYTDGDSGWVACDACARSALHAHGAPHADAVEPG